MGLCGGCLHLVSMGLYCVNCDFWDLPAGMERGVSSSTNGNGNGDGNGNGAVRDGLDVCLRLADDE